jgi:flavin reductase (DIM6/NTAB) family NADH-FMN oxidoreductase RutF
MTLQTIQPFDFTAKSFELWEKTWFLLTAGDFASGKYNAMTVAWGGLGIMWGKPVAQVVVRPTRHTYGFINEYPTFTLTAYDNQYKKALGLLGTKSGRDGDKITESGLTPQAAKVVAAPSFAQAKLSIECKTIYWQDMLPGNFLDPTIESSYENNDYHRFYLGEIVHILGTEEYR